MVRIPNRTGCGRPVRPVVCTFRKFNFASALLIKQFRGGHRSSTLSDCRKNCQNKDIIREIIFKKRQQCLNQIIILSMIALQ